MSCFLFTAAFAVQLLSPAAIDPGDAHAGDFLDADTQAYVQTAREAYEAGNYDLAIRYYLAALSMNIDDEIMIYNVACCYALKEDVELAALYLQRAVLAGYRDLDFVRGDPDFDAVRDDPYFIGAMASISSAIGEPPEYHGEIVMIRGESALPCLVRLPDDYEYWKEYTLVVGLHGYGDSPQNFIRLWDRFYYPDFIYACPRAPYPFMENNLTGYSWFLPMSDEFDVAEVDRISSDYVVSVVEELKERYPVRDVYLLGFSQGCALTWMTGIYHPEEFSGLVGLGGRLDTTYIDLDSAGDLAGMRAFVANGTLDEGATVDEGMVAVEILRGLGVETEFRTWEGVHAVGSPTLKQVQQWMGSLPPE